MVPLPFGIEIPPLQTFTFLQVTGRVIARTIQGTTTAGPEAPPSEIVDDPKAKAKARHTAATKTPATGGPGSPAREEVPATPLTKGNRAALDKLQESVSSGKKRGRPASASAKKQAKA